MSRKSSNFASAFVKNGSVFCEMLKEVRLTTQEMSTENQRVTKIIQKIF